MCLCLLTSVPVCVLWGVWLRATEGEGLWQRSGRISRIRAPPPSRTARAHTYTHVCALSSFLPLPHYDHMQVKRSREFIRVNSQTVKAGALCLGSLLARSFAHSRGTCTHMRGHTHTRTVGTPEVKPGHRRLSCGLEETDRLQHE